MSASVSILNSAPGNVESTVAAGSPGERRVCERIRLLTKRLSERDDAEPREESSVPVSPRKVVRTKDKLDENLKKDWSKSPERVEVANEWVNVEVDRLIKIIASNAEGVDPTSDAQFITFGKLFSIYQDLSNTLMGILQRARKRRIICYSGEMLYQGRDDKVRITLACPYPSNKAE